MVTVCFFSRGSTWVHVLFKVLGVCYETFRCSAVTTKKLTTGDTRLPKQEIPQTTFVSHENKTPETESRNTSKEIVRSGKIIFMFILLYHACREDVKALHGRRLVLN